MLSDWIARERVTHTLCLPSLYQLILEHAEPAKLETLRTVIVAGESCPKSIAGLHADCLPGAALYNEYGPTEATVWSTVHRIVADDPGTSVPIGRPVPGSQVYLLDALRRPTPIGVPGEMYLGGPGVARGYLNDPERTAECFVQVALDGENEQRLYRTGDLARFREDGLIEFLGRRDEQVKIRGYRIELEEIERALGAHPDVRQAAVVTRSVEAPADRVPANDDLLTRLSKLGPDAARRLIHDVDVASGAPADGATL